jgi:hypothetical protein
MIMGNNGIANGDFSANEEIMLSNSTTSNFLFSGDIINTTTIDIKLNIELITLNQSTPEIILLGGYKIHFKNVPLSKIRLNTTNSSVYYLFISNIKKDNITNGDVEIYKL